MNQSELIAKIYDNRGNYIPQILTPDERGLPQLEICQGILCREKPMEMKSFATPGEDCPKCFQHDLFKMCKIKRVNGKIVDDPEAEEGSRETLKDS